MIETRNNRENICDETTINRTKTERIQHHKNNEITTRNNPNRHQPTNLNKSFNTTHENHLKFEYVKIQPNPKPTQNRTNCPESD